MLTDFDSIGRTIMPRDISRTCRQISNHILPCLLALPMGAAVGAVDALFGRILLAVGSFRDSHVIALLPFLPIAGILITWLYKKFGNKAERGMGLVFDVGHGRESSIPLRLVPLITTSTWATHLFGGSAGREGVAVQMGATISQWVATRLKRPRNDNTLLIAGMAAGFAGLFRTPIAATMFALEVLHAGRIEYRALMPALLGSLCASATSGALGLEKFQISVAIPNTVDIGTLLKVIALGAIFGLVGSAFAWLLARAKAGAAAHLENPYLRIAVMGAAIAVFGLLLFSGRYAGLGTNLIEASLNGGVVLPLDWLAKLLLTVATLAAGFQGGEVTPLFSIGASLGCILATPFGMDPALVAALGYTAVFGGATNTFLAPVLIGAEVFGFQVLPLSFIACAVAYACNSDRTIYSGQIR